jgi:hypothetical protein
MIMNQFHQALQLGVQLYLWLERLFARRQGTEFPTQRPMPAENLHVLDAGSF